jgi:hypothetical protein
LDGGVVELRPQRSHALAATCTTGERGRALMFTAYLQWWDNHPWAALAVISLVALWGLWKARGK